MMTIVQFESFYAVSKTFFIRKFSSVLLLDHNIYLALVLSDCIKGLGVHIHNRSSARPNTVLIKFIIIIITR